MKTILVPTDFSPAANNAIQYAAEIAQKCDVGLELFNVQLSVSDKITPENTGQPSDILKTKCNEINQDFNISCIYNIENTGNTLEDVIGNKSDESNLIVMGTNGTDDFYQHIFGTNTYQVIKESNCPVLMVPEGVNYKIIQKVVFAWDYSQDNKKAFLQLKEILGMYDLEIIFLHINKQSTPLNEAEFKTKTKEVLSYLGENSNIKFEQLYSEDSENFAEIMDDYMDDSKADLLAITFYDRGKLRNLFYGIMLKEITEIARYPSLFLHI
jgi:nucleotide-binding universal stress UspA family protein